MIAFKAELAIQLNPKDAWLYSEKAITLRRFKKYEQALTAHEEAIQLNPNDAWTHTQKAITLRDF